VWQLSSGSTVVLPYGSEEYRPVELGASIFVNANKNLVRAAKEFKLNFTEYDGEDGEFAIWDGADFRFRVRARTIFIAHLYFSSYRLK